MNSPLNINLPFFAYGIFKPGELGYLQLRDLVEDCKDRATIRGSIRIRDGLPIVDPDGTAGVTGIILRFRAGREEDAYERIASLEPEQQYRWDVTSVDKQDVNYLAGKSPRKGSVPDDDEKEWCGKADRIFTTALEVVDETLTANRGFAWDLKPLFRIEMAYMLLWSAIERYCSFRYGLAGDPMNKIKRMADDPAFAAALKEALKDQGEQGSTPRDITVFRADRPKDSCSLSPENPKKSIEYYYQIRCNATHRGKAVVRDHERLEKSLSELLFIFRKVLAAAFAESEKPT